MADTTPTIPIEVADNYDIRIPRGQPLKRYFSKFGGIIDFSAITLDQANALYKAGMAALRPKSGGDSSMKSVAKTTSSKSKTA